MINGNGYRVEATLRESVQVKQKIFDGEGEKYSTTHTRIGQEGGVSSCPGAITLLASCEQRLIKIVTHGIK